MTITSAKIIMGGNALLLKDAITNISYNNVSVQPFVDLNDFKNNTPAEKPYATLEPDFWLLDGNFKFVPASGSNSGYMSLDQSPGSGDFNFTPIPEIVFDFNDYYDTEGLTFQFSVLEDEYIDYVRVVFYGLSGTLSDVAYTPSTNLFFTNNPITGFNKILIGLHSTNKATRFAKLLDIQFDLYAVFSGESITAASLTEQINPLSIEIQSNSIEFSLYSAEGDFSITAPAGIYAQLAFRDPVDIYETIDNLTIYLGRFYLEEWESQNENEASFKALDAVALLDNPLYIGRYAPFHTVGDNYTHLIVTEMFSNVSVGYHLDSALQNVPFTGWIPRGNVRKSLQLLCFAIGAYVTCSRSKVIQIFPFRTIEDATFYDRSLSNSDMSITSPLTLLPLVTAAECLAHYYFSVDEDGYEVLLKETLDAGNYRLYFNLDVPVWDTFIVTGATNTTTGQWKGTYIDINVAVSGEVVITGSKYRKTTSPYTVVNPSLPLNTQPNIIKISENTSSIWPHQSWFPLQLDAEKIIQRVYDYYQQRYVQNTKTFGINIRVGEAIVLDVQSGKTMEGIVEKTTVDLVKGFVTDVEIKGNILP